MSIQAMAWVFDKAPTDLKPSETLTLLVLANHSNGEGGHAYPSVGRICKEAKLGESTVREALAALVTRGILEVQSESTNRMPTMYKFRGVADPGWMPELLHSGGPESRGPKSGGPNPVARGPESGGLGVQNPDPNHQITNREPSNIAPARDDDGVIDVGDYRDVGPDYGKGGPVQHHPQQAARPPQAPNENSGVSNQNGRCRDGGVYGEDCAYNTLDEELAHPFWTPENVEYFKALIEPYPKQKLGQQHLSMHAWRTVVGEQAAEQAWADQYWRGLHNWKIKWETEKTDPQYIPWFPNFIKNKKWLGTPPPPPR